MLFVNLLQNPYVCIATHGVASSMDLGPDCEMGVRVTNARPFGAHLVRLTAGFSGSGVASCWPAARIEAKCLKRREGFVREIRKHYINVRFSEKEFEKLNAQMHLSGYNNRSRYIRYALLSQRVRIRRNLSRNDANVAKQLELLCLELKRIGVNYNQRVKTLNRLANVTDKQGNAIINARDIEHDMSEMKSMMSGMVKTFSAMWEEVIGCTDGEEDEREKDDAVGP